MIPFNFFSIILLIVLTINASVIIYFLYLLYTIKSKDKEESVPYKSYPHQYSPSEEAIGVPDSDEILSDEERMAVEWERENVPFYDEEDEEN